MKDIKLPNDISGYVKKKIIKRVLYLFVLIAAFAAANVYLWHEIKDMNMMARAAIFITSIILPFVISGVPLKMIDRSWRGEVISVEIKEETGVYMHGGQYATPYAKHVIILNVKKDNGEIEKVRAAEYGTKNRFRGEDVPNEGDINHHMNDYRKGDLVYHFYGIPHNLVVGSEIHRPTNCVMCGCRNPKPDDKCFNCGYSLINTDQK